MVNVHMLMLAIDDLIFAWFQPRGWLVVSHARH